MDGNKLDKFYQSGVYFSCAVPFLALESLVIYLGWHLGFKIDQLSFQQSEGDVRKKIFLQHSFKGFNILFSCHNFPFDSIHKLLFAKTKKIPLESAHCHGGRFLPWYDKWREMHCEQRNVFVIFVKKDERHRHRGWNALIENTPQQTQASSQQTALLVIWKKGASKRTNKAAPW